MDDLIIFNKAYPFNTAKKTTAQQIREEHGSIDALAIMDGTHLHYHAVFRGVFIGKLEAILEEIKK